MMMLRSRSAVAFKAQRLREAGLSLSEIAILLGITRQAVHTLLRARPAGDHPIERMATYAGGKMAFCHLVAITPGTFDWLRAGRYPKEDTWQKLAAVSRRIDAPQEVKDEYRRWLESIKPVRLAHTHAYIPLPPGADVLRLRITAINAARRAVEDLRSGAGLRPPVPQSPGAALARGVGVRISLRREDMELLRRACAREGRTLGSVILSYFDGARRR